MNFICWIIEPAPEFKPIAWEDNPKYGIAVAPMPDPFDRTDIETARGIAQGFNNGEIRNPIGLWAIVCELENQPIKGRRVNISTPAELN
tara:strand:- start:936 stop:1202 length:267 start_codon:yes stop_codon:yes gene_type:complete